MTLKPFTPKPVPDNNLLTGLLGCTSLICQIALQLLRLGFIEVRFRLRKLFFDTRDLCAEVLGYEYVDCDDNAYENKGNPERNQKQGAEDHPISGGLEQQSDCRKDCSGDESPDGIMKGGRDVIFEFHGNEVDPVAENHASTNHNP